MVKIGRHRPIDADVPPLLTRSFFASRPKKESIAFDYKGSPPHMSGDSNSDPPLTCTEPHCQHALMLSVIAGLSWLFFRFHLRLALGRVGVGIGQPRSDQSALSLLT
jgi:hypothetical protein